MHSAACGQSVYETERPDLRFLTDRSIALARRPGALLVAGVELGLLDLLPCEERFDLAAHLLVGLILE